MKMPKLIKNLIDSLNHNGNGGSLKKILAVGFFVLITYITIKYTSIENLVMVLTIHTATLSALMGISTYHELKTRNQDNNISTDITNTNPDQPNVTTH